MPEPSAIPGKNKIVAKARKYRGENARDTS